MSTTKISNKETSSTTRKQNSNSTTQTSKTSPTTTKRAEPNTVTTPKVTEKTSLPQATTRIQDGTLSPRYPKTPEGIEALAEWMNQDIGYTHRWWNDAEWMSLGRETIHHSAVPEKGHWETVVISPAVPEKGHWE